LIILLLSSLTFLDEKNIGSWPTFAGERTLNTIPVWQRKRAPQPHELKGGV
jgi:hypothetical protein